MPSNKRKRGKERRPTIHPRNKYSENPPDFRLLASLYPSFEPFVFYASNGSPRIDWTDFNATRELTRVLLHHDHGVNWWIPDGQLCPTVPNRSNYIHWIEDLLSSHIIERSKNSGDKVKGFDIGTGANCIYPLLGASLLGWSFVGSDITEVALEWAEINVNSNPHLSELIEIRKAGCARKTPNEETEALTSDEEKIKSGEGVEVESVLLKSAETDLELSSDDCGPPVLIGSVRNDENFDFCMCNPPFFESMEEAGLNPKTSCGGTSEEMVCPGGERAFIIRIIEDSVLLKHSFRWYTSMVGRKANLKVLVSKLWEVGVSIVKTTEFVQGETCRWGLAWSFLPTARKIVASHVTAKNNLSFVLEGLQRQFSAVHILKSVESYFLASGSSCKSNPSLFVVDVTASHKYCNEILSNGGGNFGETSRCQDLCNEILSNGGGNFGETSRCQDVHERPETDGSSQSDELRFRVSVFQQIPGSLLLKGSLQRIGSPLSGAFVLIFQQLEEALKKEFLGRV